MKIKIILTKGEIKLIKKMVELENHTNWFIDEDNELEKPLEQLNEKFL